MSRKSDLEFINMPPVVWVRPLLSGGGKQLAAVRPESPLIDQRKNSDSMAYKKYYEEQPITVEELEWMKMPEELAECGKYHKGYNDALQDVIEKLNAGGHD